MRLLNAVAVCGAGGLVIVTACSLTVDFGVLQGGPGPMGGSAGQGEGAGGAGGAAGGAGGVLTVPPLVPDEGSYVYKALTSGNVHGLVTDIFVDGVFATQSVTRAAPDDPFLATVVYLDPDDYDAGSEPYEACWRIAFRYRPSQSADPWSDALDLCTRGGRIDIQLNTTVQNWTVSGAPTETLNTVDCRITNGFVPAPLVKPSCEIPDVDDCMEPQLSFFYSGCEGSNDKVDDVYTSGGRATWVKRAGEDTITIAGAEVPAFHIFEERTIFDAAAASTVGVLDPDHVELNNLGTRNHWWFHRETGMVLRVQRETKLRTTFSFDYMGLTISGETVYDEDWAYELTSLVAQPLPGGGGAGGVGGAGGAGGNGGAGGT